MCGSEQILLLTADSEKGLAVWAKNVEAICEGKSMSPKLM